MRICKPIVTNWYNMLQLSKDSGTLRKYVMATTLLSSLAAAFTSLTLLQICDIQTRLMSWQYFKKIVIAASLSEPHTYVKFGNFVCIYICNYLLYIRHSINVSIFWFNDWRKSLSPHVLCYFVTYVYDTVCRRTNISMGFYNYSRKGQLSAW